MELSKLKKAELRKLAESCGIPCDAKHSIPTIIKTITDRIVQRTTSNHILSIDVGITNLAYALVEKDTNTVIRWKHMSIQRLLPETYQLEGYVSSIHMFCLNEFGDLDSYDCVIERQQQKRGRPGQGILPTIFNLNIIESILHSWFLGIKQIHTFSINPVQLSKTQNEILVQRGKEAPADKKKASQILITDCLLFGTIICPDIFIHRFCNGTKRDDLADCLTQAYIFNLWDHELERLQRTLI